MTPIGDRRKFAPNHLTEIISRTWARNMLLGQDRDRLRGIYCEAWRRHREALPLEPLQAQIVAVIRQHPEYQRLLEDPEKALGREYLPETGETNPFLHMGMHLAIREQVDTDRPAGMRALYRQLSAAYTDTHALDHRLMECLGEAIWRAQRDGRPIGEDDYMACVRAIAREHQ